MREKYNQELLVEAVRTSKSIRQVLQKLSLREAGGNYLTIKKKIEKNGLDTSHFTGKAWNFGLKFKPLHAKPLHEILVANSEYQSHKLRKRLIRENIFEAKCSNCNLKEWLGLPIPLELEHIDGDRYNNRLENLKLLCPNCHALTATWRRRKK
jgi:Zn finger protein HypA/HybF involved in hydrogenase expression